MGKKRKNYRPNSTGLVQDHNVKGKTIVTLYGRRIEVHPEALDDYEVFEKMKASEDAGPGHPYAVVTLIEAIAGGDQDTIGQIKAAVRGHTGGLRMEDMAKAAELMVAQITRVKDPK